MTTDQLIDLMNFSAATEPYVRSRRFAGLDIAIENPRGSVRSGKDRSGKPWSVTMNHDYGFIKKANGADGEGLDVFLGPKSSAENAYVVHQNQPDTGKYDEDKCMLGFETPEAAKAAYLSNYNTPKFYRSMTIIPMKQFKVMLTKGMPGGVHWKRKHGRDHDTAAMFSAETDALLDLLDLSRSLSYAAEEEGKWVTMGGGAGPHGEKHAGGTPVHINAEGQADKGPSDLIKKHPLYDVRQGKIYEGSKKPNVTPHPPQPESDAGNAASAGEAVAEREPGAESGAEANQGGPQQWKQAADQSLTPDEKQRMEENYRHGVYLVNMPVSMLTPGNKATTGGMANLEKVGGNPNPGVVNMRKSVNGETEYFVDDGNHRLEYAKRKGQATIPMYVAPDRDVDINELAAKLGGESPQSGGNADVDVSRQFGLFAKDKAGAPVEVGERAGQANLFNPSKYKTAEKPEEAPDDEAGVKVKTNEMFPAKEEASVPSKDSGAGRGQSGGVPNPAEQPASKGMEDERGDGGEGGSTPSAPPIQPQPPVPGEGAEEKEAAGKVESPQEKTDDEAAMGGMGDSGVADEAQAGTTGNADSGLSGKTEQEIAQAVNRGEMSVEDVLETHPHLAGDALVEQHRREQREAAEAAEAEREAEEQGMGDEGSGEVPDFMEGLEEPESGQTQQQTPEVAPEPVRSSSPAPKPAKGGKKQRPKGLLEQTLLDNYERESADQDMADDEALADFHHPFTFKRDPKTKSGFPGEVERFLEGAPRGVKRLFELTDSATGGQGADAMGKLGEQAYFDLAGRRGGMTGRLRAAIEAGKKSQDPQVQWAASYYDLDKPEGKSKTEKADPRKWVTGTQATVKGVPVEVVKNAEGHRSLKDGGELPEIPLDAVSGKLPFDKGSVKPGKPSFEESGKWSPSKTNSAEKMAESLVKDPGAAERMTGDKPKNALGDVGDVFPDVEMPAEEKSSTTPGADPVTTAETEPESTKETNGSESPESPTGPESERPESPQGTDTAVQQPPIDRRAAPQGQVEPQSPETVAKDLGDVLLALGTDRRTVDKLVTETMNSEWAGSVDDAIRFALARYKGERPAGGPKVKKPAPTPQETPAAPQETPQTPPAATEAPPAQKESATVYNPKTDLYEPVEKATTTPAPRQTPNPANAVVDEMLTKIGKGKPHQPQGMRKQPPKTPSVPLVQQIRQSAKLPQPPSKLPTEPHQAPPAYVKKSAQSSSALAASKPIHVSKTPHVREPAPQRVPAAHGRFPASHAPRSVASAMPRTPALNLHTPRSSVRTTIGQQPGQTHPVKIRPSRGLSQSEVQRAKGRELKELFSADADESLARTLSLLEMLT